MRESLSNAEARRLALGAQGFARLPRDATRHDRNGGEMNAAVACTANANNMPGKQSTTHSSGESTDAENSGGRGVTGVRQLRAVIERLQLLQIDSVNVFDRSHYLVVFARVGGYDKGLLDRVLYSPCSPTASGGYIEQWAHEAAFVRAQDWPLLAFRRREYAERYRNGKEAWGLEANVSMIDWLRAELAERGPLAASEIEHEANVRRGPWWGWSEVKRALEIMFRSGQLVTAGRTRFERRYALPEQVLGSSLLNQEVPTQEAVRELVTRSARALGVATLADLADYYRLSTALTRVAVQELSEAGVLVPATIQGWERGGQAIPAWMHRDVRVPRSIHATAALSPFDPLVWHRDRLLRVFGMHYRIEVYTPAHKRQYGYYSLPVLIDEHIVGRVDLKSDRRAGQLRVQSAWVEDSHAARAPEIAERLKGLLLEAAVWQDLGGVVSTGRGTLAPALTTVGIPLTAD